MKKIIFSLCAIAMVGMLLVNIENKKGFVKANVAVSPQLRTLKPNIILPQSAKEGDTVFITVKSSKLLQAPCVLFSGKKIRLFEKEKGVYRGFIGFDAWAKTGSYKLKFSDETGTLCDERNLTLVSRKYPSQYIVLGPSKSSLEPTNYELAQVQYAKTAYSEKAFYSHAPFNAPTEGCIASVYGLNRFYNNVIGGWHKGVDIVAPKGQPIKALTGGVVTIANANFRLHGGTVGINHGQGLTTLYLHMSKIYVKPGQILKAGEPIGEVGSTGIATGPHLHWGLYVNGVPVDPYLFWTKPANKCS